MHILLVKRRAVKLGKHLMRDFREAVECLLFSGRPADVQQHKCKNLNFIFVVKRSCCIRQSFSFDFDYTSYSVSTPNI